MEWTDDIRTLDGIAAYLVANLRPPTPEEVAGCGLALRCPGSRLLLCYRGPAGMHYVFQGEGILPFSMHVGPPTSNPAGRMPYASAHCLLALLENVAEGYLHDFCGGVDVL